MGSPAGDYYEYFLWQVFNKDTKKWKDTEVLRGYSEDLTADEVIAFGMKNSTTDTRIHIRQYPDISAKDRLYDIRFDLTYDVTGVRIGDNEMIIDCRRWERTP